MTSSVVLDALRSPFEFHGGVSPDLHEHATGYLLSSEHHNMKDAVATNSGLAESGDPHTNATNYHLGMIWKILSERNANGTSFLHEHHSNGDRIQDSTMELVIMQATLLIFILLVALLWAFCCKTRCIGDSETVAMHVAALARKISSASTRDLPPSYSKVDLTVIGLSINDHFNPPPTYDRAIEAAANSTNAEYIASTVNPIEYMHTRRTSSRLSVISAASSNVTVVGGGVRGDGGLIWSAPHRFHPQPSSQSLPLPPCLVAAGRRRSVLSADGGNRSRRVSFVDEIASNNIQENSSEQVESGQRFTELERNEGLATLDQQAMPCSTIVEMASSEEDSETEMPSRE